MFFTLNLKYWFNYLDDFKTLKIEKEKSPAVTEVVDVKKVSQYF